MCYKGCSVLNVSHWYHQDWTSILMFFTAEVENECSVYAVV